MAPRGNAGGRAGAPSECRDAPSDDELAFFANGDEPAHWIVHLLCTLLKCLSAPLRWLACASAALAACCARPPPHSLWAALLVLLRVVCYSAAVSNLPDHALQAAVDLIFAVQELLGVWLGKGVSRCACSAAVQKRDALDGRGEWLWPKGAGRYSDSAPPLPGGKVIFFVHGGAFVLCNAVTHRLLTYDLVRRTGCTVVVPAYSRPPKAQYPIALDEVAALYARLCSYYGAQNVIIAGDSAGANLAMSTALRNVADHGAAPPAGAVLISPWCDLSEASLAAESMRANASTDFLPYTLIARFMRDYGVGASVKGDEPLVSAVYADPVALGRALPNVFHCYGTGEELLDQNRALRSRFEAGGAAYEAYELPGEFHVAPLFASVVYGPSPPPPAAATADKDPEAAESPPPVVALEKMAAFINAITAVPRPPRTSLL
ncbi:Alpha/Beta hydrolase protein [Pelagophyceae sp. CCMP2097]|nr:Alpha/Beta hydrolase protein [Pelagophyceae sp. CCMP2097]|mmetsp:Transcript_15936/g.54382  ORF Transcript_15936/g.54382 Transcript_15936/m.54382 type:complete len:433 (-) Transcript_15936:33-1331(-)